jgi:hypothetical protein
MLSASCSSCGDFMEPVRRVHWYFLRLLLGEFRTASRIRPCIETKPMTPRPCHSCGQPPPLGAFRKNSNDFTIVASTSSTPRKSSSTPTAPLSREWRIPSHCCHLHHPRLAYVVLSMAKSMPTLASKLCGLFYQPQSAPVHIFFYFHTFWTQ